MKEHLYELYYRITAIVAKKPRIRRDSYYRESIFENSIFHINYD
jgi:hypothetical protein